MIPRILFALAVCALPPAAQVLTLPPGPFAAGETIDVALYDNSPFGLPLQGGGTTGGPPLALIHTSGQLITPYWMSHVGAGMGSAPGSSNTLTFTTPAAGPGSSGSSVLYYPHGAGAAVRLDVGAPTPGFPALCAFPGQIYTGYASHLVSYGTYGPTGLMAIVDTSGAGHTFGSGDRIDIMPAGGTTALATRWLAGLFVPPNGRLLVSLPLSGLPVVPYTVQVAWMDPVAGRVVRRSGILPDFGVWGPGHDSQGWLNLHLPDGCSVPVGGAITAYLTGQLSWYGDTSSSVAPVYALMLGIADGNTTLPGGGQIGLSLDRLVVASLAGNAFGALSNHIGSPTSVVVYHPGVHTYTGPGGHFQSYEAAGITIAHPNVPGLAGSVLRAAAVLMDPALGVWVPSQMEEVTLQ